MLLHPYSKIFQPATFLSSILGPLCPSFANRDATSWQWNAGILYFTGRFKMRTSTFSMVAALVMVAGSAMAGPAELVYAVNSHVPTGSAKSQVPGLSGITFTNFAQPFRAPTNGRWGVVGTTTATPTSADQVYISGQGLVGTLVAQEGVTPIDGTRFVNFSRLDTPRVRDNGDWAMAFRPAGATGSTEVVIQSVGGAISLVADGTSIAQTALPGYSYTGSFSQAYPTSAGVAFRAGLTDNIFFSATEAGFLANGSSAVALVNTFVPSGQPGGGTEVLADIDTDAFSVSADGAHWGVLGELMPSPALPKVFVYDGGVLLLQGQPVPGLPGVTVTGISDAYVDSNGSWYARGTGTQNWVVRDGQLLAAVGQPIFAGSSENWVSFVDVRGNARGDYAIQGTAGSPARVVIVVNGKRVIASANDAIDFDNNGVAESNRFILGWSTGRFTFGNDYQVYFAARVKDTLAGTTDLDLGQTTPRNRSSLLRRTWCNTDVAGPGQSIGPDGDLTADDIIVFLNYFFAGNLRADVAGPGQSTTVDGALTADDIIVFLNGFFAGC